MGKWIVALIPDKDVKPNIWQSAFQNAWKHLYYHNINKDLLNEERKCSVHGRADTEHKADYNNFTKPEKKLSGKSKQHFVVRKWRIQSHSVELRAIWAWSHPKCCIQCTKMWPARHIELGHCWTFQTPSLPPISPWASFVPSLKFYSMPGLNCQRYICKGLGNTSHTAQDAVRVLHFKVFCFLLGFNVLILMFWSCGLCRVEHQTHFYWQQGCARQGSGTAADNQV